MTALSSAAPVDPGSADGSLRPGSFPCGHARTGRNALVFKSAKSPGGKASRCRQCANAYQLMYKRAGSGALRLVIQMHADGTLSEGQLTKATGLTRVEVRRLADKSLRA